MTRASLAKSNRSHRPHVHPSVCDYAISLYFSFEFFMIFVRFLSAALDQLPSPSADFRVEQLFDKYKDAKFSIK